jgi:RNA polymerase sigma-70 factor (sigma-E family)
VRTKEPNARFVSLVRVTVVTRKPIPPFVGTFDEFFDRHADEMVSLARLITGSVESAEEIAQDAFTVVYQRWDSVRDPVPYLRSTVINRSRSHVRRVVVGREKLRSIPHDVQEVALAEPDLALRRALSTLNERQRTAVVLRFWADWSETQIASELGCRNGTVKSLLSRSLEQLRKAVDQ